MVVVALGKPGVPVTCCAIANTGVAAVARISAASVESLGLVLIDLKVRSA